MLLHPWLKNATILLGRILLEASYFLTALNVSIFVIYRVMKPEGEEAKELEEILAKRQKRGKVDDDKPLEEKTVFHSKY